MITSMILIAILWAGSALALDVETDVAAALERARERETYVLVDVFTTWCGPCKVFQADYEKDPRIREALAPFEFVSLDAEAEPGLSFVKTHPVRSFPTFLLLDSEGTEVHRASGYGSAERFGPMILEMARDPLPFEDRVARFEAEPTLAAAQKLREMASSRGERALELDLARRAVELGGTAWDRIALLGALRHEFFAERAEASELTGLADAVLADPACDVSMLNMVYNNMMMAQRKDPQVDLSIYARAFVEAADTAGWLEPDHGMYAYVRQIELEQVEQDFEAAADFKKAQMPDGWTQDAQRLNDYAWYCFEHRVNLEDAEEHARMALGLEDATPSSLAAVIDTAAEFAFLRGDVDEALRLVRRSSELAPDTEYYREQILRFEAARRSP